MKARSIRRLGAFSVLAVAFGFASLPLAVCAQTAAVYPSKPIHIVEGFAVGSATDYLARVVGKKLAERLGQPVVVDNRPGAGSNIGAGIVAKAEPNGYTLFMGNTSALAPSRNLFAQLPYDAMRDFAFVTLVASGTFLVVAHASVPARSVADLVALARSKPGQITYGSSGVGSPTHLAGALLKSLTNTDIVHVPCKGGSAFTAAIAAGEVQFGFASPAAASPLINTGRLNALAVTSAQRSNAMPDLPTIAETGVAGFDVTPRYGVLAPAATPPALVELLNAEIRKILQLPDVRAMFAAQALEPTASTSEEFRAIMQAEIEQWTKVIKAANIQPK
jgi:tripartite-type tricarboxylate transporter receptor subunit TctC